eukprot:GAHX01002445.1.p1 GENE.GAHX01002445.1~~GAHX01002445.1.p1  ORF type:complete len:303 (-),score=61.41 GAHX01002445.1:33-941(-)
MMKHFKYIVFIATIAFILVIISQLGRLDSNYSADSGFKMELKQNTKHCGWNWFKEDVQPNIPTKVLVKTRKTVPTDLTGMKISDVDDDTKENTYSNFNTITSVITNKQILVSYNNNAHCFQRQLENEYVQAIIQLKCNNFPDELNVKKMEQIQECSIVVKVDNTINEVYKQIEVIEEGKVVNMKAIMQDLSLQVMEPDKEMEIFEENKTKQQDVKCILDGVDTQINKTETNTDTNKKCNDENYKAENYNTVTFNNKETEIQNEERNKLTKAVLLIVIASVVVIVLVILLIKKFTHSPRQGHV